MFFLSVWTRVEFSDLGTVRFLRAGLAAAPDLPPAPGLEATRAMAVAEVEKRSLRVVVVMKLFVVFVVAVTMLRGLLPKKVLREKNDTILSLAFVVYQSD